MKYGVLLIVMVMPFLNSCKGFFFGDPFWIEKEGLSKAAQDQINDRVVRIRSQRTPDKTSLSAYQWGTAFYINEYTVITCCHNLREVESSEPHYELMRNGEVIDALLVARFEEIDLAVLETDPVKLKPLLFKEKNAKGCPVLLIGYPQSPSFSVKAPIVTCGVVGGKVELNIPEESKQRDYLMVDGVAYPGESGGPVIDANGDLVGMIHAVLVTNETHWGGFTYVLGSYKIRSTLLKMKKEKRVQHEK